MSKISQKFFSFTAIEHGLMFYNCQLLIVISLISCSAVEFAKMTTLEINEARRLNLTTVSLVFSHLDKITVKFEALIGVEPNALWAILKTLDYSGGGIIVPFVTSLFLTQS